MALSISYQFESKYKCIGLQIERNPERNPEPHISFSTLSPPELELLTPSIAMDPSPAAAQAGELTQAWLWQPVLARHPGGGELDRAWRIHS